MKMVKWFLLFFLVGITTGCFKSSNGKNWFAHSIEMRCKSNFRYGRGNRGLFGRGLFCLAHGLTSDARTIRSAEWSSEEHPNILAFPLFVEKKDLDVILGDAPTDIILAIQGTGTVVHSATVMGVTIDESGRSRSKRDADIEFNVELQDECLDPSCTLEGEMETNIDQPTIRLRRSPQRRRSGSFTPTKATTPKPVVTKPPKTTSTTTASTIPTTTKKTQPITTTITTKKPASSTTSTTVAPPTTSTTGTPSTTSKSPSKNHTSVVTKSTVKQHNGTSNSSKDGNGNAHTGSSTNLDAIAEPVIPIDASPEASEGNGQAVITEEGTESVTLSAISSSKVNNLLEPKVVSERSGNIIGENPIPFSNTSLPKIPNVSIPDMGSSFMTILIWLLGGIGCIVATVSAYFCRVFRCCFQRAPAGTGERGVARFTATSNN